MFQDRPQRQTAAELFAASLVEICPSIQIVYTAPTRVGFICDLVSPFPLTKEYMDMALSNVKEKIKSSFPIQVSEMMTKNARDLLVHKKQRIRADQLLDSLDPLIYVVTIGDYVNAVFDEPTTDLSSIGVISVEETVARGELIYHGKPKEITRISAALVKDRDALKEYRKKEKASKGLSHELNGLKWGLFDFLEGVAIWKEEGLFLRRRLEERVAKDLKEGGFNEVFFYSENPFFSGLRQYSNIFFFERDETLEEGEFGLKDAPNQWALAAFCQKGEKEKIFLLQLMEKWGKLLCLQFDLKKFSKGSLVAVLEGYDPLGLTFEVAKLEEGVEGDKKYLVLKVYIDSLFALLAEQFLEKELLKNTLL